MKVFLLIIAIWFGCCFVFTSLWCAVAIFRKRKSSLKPIAFGPVNRARQQQRKSNKY
jgi:hypothetical protein